jgi:hypothetical protein
MSSKHSQIFVSQEKRMPDQATETKISQNQYLIVTAKLSENKTIEVSREQWTEFLNDFSKRRFGWGTKVEALNELVSDQLISEGLILNGITYEGDSGNCLINLSLVEDMEHHQTHIISEPVRIVYFSENETRVGVLEIVEGNNTKTLISLVSPMPIHIGYASHEMISAV